MAAASFRAQVSAAPLKLRGRDLRWHEHPYLPRSGERGPVEAASLRRNTELRVQPSALR